MKNLIVCLCIFIVAQTMVWLQLNGQFVWDSFRKYGIIIFSLLTWVLKGEGINTKTLISLCLASCLVLIQIFWK